MGLIGEAIASIDGLRYVLAGRRETEDRFWTKMKFSEPPLIGTTYPNATRAFFNGRVQLMYTPGSTEVLPYLRPEVDAICELVQSGDSLRENNLKIFKDDIAPVKLMLVRQAESATINVKEL